MTVSCPMQSIPGLDPLLPVVTGRFRHTKLWQVPLGRDLGVIGD